MEEPPAPLNHSIVKRPMPLSLAGKNCAGPLFVLFVSKSDEEMDASFELALLWVMCSTLLDEDKDILRPAQSLKEYRIRHFDSAREDSSVPSVFSAASV